MTATATKSRKPLRAPKGTVAWVGETHIRITDEDGGRQTYRVLRDVDGWWLAKADGTLYRVDVSRPLAWTCSCSDATYRPERRNCCRHQLALRAALARVKF